MTRILIFRTAGNVGKTGSYNEQEIGLAKALKAYDFEVSFARAGYDAHTEIFESIHVPGQTHLNI